MSTSAAEVTSSSRAGAKPARASSGTWWICSTPPVDVQVSIDSWEIECCLPPPGVGDVVAWRLRWVEPSTGPGQLTAPWRTTRLPPAPDGHDSGPLLEHGGVAAWWPTADAAVPPTGRLVAKTHAGVPDDVPPTEGMVLAVHVVQQRCTRTDAGFDPVRGECTLRAVQRSPRWFDHGPSAAHERHSVDDETGVLIELRVRESTPEQ